jgi:hypothetical protein
VIEKAAMMTTGIIILPVNCIKRNGVDLARQHQSQVGHSRNVVELRRARLNRAFERLNRLLDDSVQQPMRAGKILSSHHDCRTLVGP